MTASVSFPTATGGWVSEDVDVIGGLRQLLPKRPLSFIEAHEVAEQQANVLLGLLDVEEPPVPQEVISSLPEVSVEVRERWPTSAMTVRTPSDWHIVIKAEEPHKRQRFSLAHEFKHVLDDPVINDIHADLPEEEQKQRAERVCDYFAACLLMPREWIEQDWSSGLQGIEELARRYHVSKEAMTTRLSELGLIPMSPALQKKLGRYTGAIDEHAVCA